MIQSQLESVNQKEMAENLGQAILELCNGYSAGLIKTSMTLALATCINNNENIEEKLVDINLIYNLLRDICKTPTLH